MSKNIEEKLEKTWSVKFPKDKPKANLAEDEEGLDFVVGNDRGTIYTVFDNNGVLYKVAKSLCELKDGKYYCRGLHPASCKKTPTEKGTPLDFARNNAMELLPRK